jgi:HlyD family secretion protein
MQRRFRRNNLMANKKSSGWWKWILALVILGGGGGGLWYYLQTKDSAPQYQTAPIARGDLQQVVTASGSLNPVLNVEVGSQISGRIQALFADFNSTVKSNQIVAEIDPSTYQVAVLRMEAQLSNSMANLALAQVQARRAESLFQERLISGEGFDTAQAQLQAAQANVKSAEANLRSSQVDLNRCTIVAPVDGVVISRNVDVGQTVAASFNTPRLFVIANDLSKMQIGALVSEADIGEVAVGQDVNFTVDAFPYRTFRGKIAQIRYGAVTNQSVVSYNAIIDVDNADLKLLPGMTATVSIIIAERENTLKIPNAALRFRPPETAAAKTGTNAPTAAVRPEGGRRGEGGGGGGGREGGRGPRGGGGRAGADQVQTRTVYLLNAEKGPGQPELTPVTIKTGITDGVSTEVLEGLKENDPVVTSVTLPDAPPSAQQANPFGRGGGMPRRF